MKTLANKILVAATMILSAATPIMAQNTTTGYFLDDYTYRYRMNPAFANERCFISMPGLGNVNVNTKGTLGVKDVIYNINGKTTTFLNPQVSAKEFLGNINDKNLFTTDINYTLFATGFKAFNGYNTITLGARSFEGIKVPGSAFRFLKEGISNKTYDIGQIHMQGAAFAEFSIGHSHQIGSDLRVGANVKVLFGIVGVDADFKHADLELGTDSWRIRSEADLNLYMKGAYYETDINSTTGNRYVSDIKTDDVKPNGFGVAVDLGVVYTPSFLPDFQFSAALLDLGSIKWSNNIAASTQGQKVFDSDKYTFNVDDKAPNSFSNEFDKIKDELSSLYELTDLGDKGSASMGLGATLNIGALYNLPVYRAMSFGLLNTTRMNGDFSWTDFRASANWAPSRVFDAAVSFGAGTFGASMGWLANLHCKGFNFYVGMDQLPSKLSKQGIPLSNNFSFNTGINFLF